MTIAIIILMILSVLIGVTGINQHTKTHYDFAFILLNVEVILLWVIILLLI